jgi:hypothetical protein
MKSIDLARIIPRKKTLEALTMIMLLSFSSAIVSDFNSDNRIAIASQQTQKTKEFTLIADETILNISPSKKLMHGLIMIPSLVRLFVLLKEIK